MTDTLSESTVMAEGETPVGQRNAIPAKYIINSYFRDIAASSLWYTDGRHPCQMALKSKQAADSFEQGLINAGSRIVRYDRKSARKFDKAVEFDCLYVQAEKFLRSGDAGERWDAANDAIVLRRARAVVRPRKVDYCSVPAGLMLTRHTLERIYERQHLRHDTFNDQIQRMLADVELRFSFALAADLFVGGAGSQAQASALIPIDGGIIIFKNTHVVVDRGGNPCYGVRLLPSGHYNKPVVSDSQFTGRTMLNGEAVVTFIMAYGATYVSDDLLNNEQKGYIAEFEREYAKITPGDIALRIGSRRYEHEKKIDIQPIKVSQRLHYLSSINTRAHDTDVHMAIGWSSIHADIIKKLSLS